MDATWNDDALWARCWLWSTALRREGVCSVEATAATDAPCPVNQGTCKKLLIGPKISKHGSIHLYQNCVVLASLWHFRVEWSTFDGIFLVILGVSFFHVFSNVVKVSSGLHKQLVKRSIMSSGCTILRVLRGPCRQPFPWSFWQITLRIGMTFWRFQWVMLEFQWPCPTEWSTPWAWCSSIILRFTCQNLHVWRGLVFKLQWEKQMEPSRLQNHHNSSPSCGGNRVQYGICDGCRMNLRQCRCLHVPSRTGSW